MQLRIHCPQLLTALTLSPRICHKTNSVAVSSNKPTNLFQHALCSFHGTMQVKHCRCSEDSRFSIIYPSLAIKAPFLHWLSAQDASVEHMRDYVCAQHNRGFDSIRYQDSDALSLHVGSTVSLKERIVSGDCPRRGCSSIRIDEAHSSGASLAEGSSSLQVSEPDVIVRVISRVNQKLLGKEVFRMRTDV